MQVYAYHIFCLIFQKIETYRSYKNDCFVNKIIRGKISWFPIAIPLLIASVINLKQLVAGKVLI